MKHKYNTSQQCVKILIKPRTKDVKAALKCWGGVRSYLITDLLCLFVVVISTCHRHICIFAYYPIAAIEHLGLHAPSQWGGSLSANLPPHRSTSDVQKLLLFWYFQHLSNSFRCFTISFSNHFHNRDTFMWNVNESFLKLIRILSP